MANYSAKKEFHDTENSVKKHMFHVKKSVTDRIRTCAGKTQCLSDYHIAIAGHRLNHSATGTLC